MDIFVALFPILIVFILLVFRRMAADLAGVIGWVVAMIVAWLYFQTPLRILLQASLGGVVASFPITLMVATPSCKSQSCWKPGQSPGWWR